MTTRKKYPWVSGILIAVLVPLLLFLLVEGCQDAQRIEAPTEAPAAPAVTAAPLIA